jgi:hypothetical protein
MPLQLIEQLDTSVLYSDKCRFGECCGVFLLQTVHGNESSRIVTQNRIAQSDHQWAGFSAEV